MSAPEVRGKDEIFDVVKDNTIKNQTQKESTSYGRIFKIITATAGTGVGVAAVASGVAAIVLSFLFPLLVPALVIKALVIAVTVGSALAVALLFASFLAQDKKVEGLSGEIKKPELA